MKFYKYFKILYRIKIEIYQNIYLKMHVKESHKPINIKYKNVCKIQQIA